MWNVHEIDKTLIERRWKDVKYKYQKLVKPCKMLFRINAVTAIFSWFLISTNRFEILRKSLVLTQSTTKSRNASSFGYFSAVANAHIKWNNNKLHFAVCSGISKLFFLDNCTMYVYACTFFFHVCVCCFCRQYCQTKRKKKRINAWISILIWHLIMTLIVLKSQQNNSDIVCK